MQFDAKGRPLPQPSPQWEKVLNTVTFGINDAVANRYEDEDLRHYIYEAAMEAVYGSDYWDWRNAQKWGG